MEHLKIKEINGKTYMTSKVVMLAANNKRNALKGYSDKSILFNYREEYKSLQAEDGYVSYFHLYVTSSEEPQEGDWMYDSHYNVIKKKSTLNGGVSCLKIIATTDLNINEPVSNEKDITYSVLPFLSKEFIESYIESHNNDKIIEDALVELELKNITK